MPGVIQFESFKIVFLAAVESFITIYLFIKNEQRDKSKIKKNLKSIFDFEPICIKINKIYY